MKDVSTKKDVSVKKRNSMKEFFRKKLVSLKRSPQIIPLIILVIACAIFTFNLNVHSLAATGNYTTTAYNNWVNTQQGQEMGGVVPAMYRIPGIYVFVITLFSILSVISYLSVYKKGKLNVFMLVIVYVMLGAMLVCDVLYMEAIKFYTGPFNTKTMESVADSLTNVTIHLVANIVSIIFVSILPLIRKLLNLIDTSVEDEYDKLIESKTEEELLIDTDEQA